MLLLHYIARARRPGSLTCQRRPSGNRFPGIRLDDPAIRLQSRLGGPENRLSVAGAEELDRPAPPFGEGWLRPAQGRAGSHVMRPAVRLPGGIVRLVMCLPMPKICGSPYPGLRCRGLRRAHPVTSRRESNLLARPQIWPAGTDRPWCPRDGKPA